MELKHFSIAEFECPCCRKASMDDHFLLLLDEIRNLLEKPISINSGFRCIAHNKKIKGSPNSQHLIGLASDISTTSFSSLDKFRLVDIAMKLGIKGVGVYSTFIHLDHREGEQSLWLG